MNNNLKHREILIDLLNNDKYIFGYKLKKLLRNYIKDDIFIGDNPHFLGLITFKLEPFKRYTIKEKVIKNGNFKGCSRYIIKTK